MSNRFSPTKVVPTSAHTVPTVLNALSRTAHASNDYLTNHAGFLDRRSAPLDKVDQRAATRAAAADIYVEIANYPVNSDSTWSGEQKRSHSVFR